MKEVMARFAVKEKTFGRNREGSEVRVLCCIRNECLSR